MLNKLLAGAVLAAICSNTHATDWSPAGEFGLVIAKGNSDASTVNGKFSLKGESPEWVHDYYVVALRAEQDSDTTASRYELGGKSGYKLNERSYIYGSLRYENDDFAPFEYQGTGSIGYGFWAIKNDATTWLFEIGPGARRAEPVGPPEAETDFIARGFMDFKHKLTATTEVFDTLLIEAASDNTFVQNEIGISVSINASLALKAALQARHNTDAPSTVDKTDTLTTINVVWAPK